MLRRPASSIGLVENRTRRSRKLTRPGNRRRLLLESLEDRRMLAILTTVGCTPGPDNYDTIQEAVDAADAGGTVEICEGTYFEQVFINKNLTVKGELDNGDRQATIAAPSILGDPYESYTMDGIDRHPIVTVQNATVTIQDLIVDGFGQWHTTKNENFIGIAYHNAGGEIDNVEVTRVRAGGENGSLQDHLGVFGIYAFSETTHTLTVRDSEINDFQRNAGLFNGSGLTVEILDNEIVGAGPTSVIAQNGIQVSEGAEATISGNTLSAMNYSPGNVSASMILLDGAGETTVSQNILTGDGGPGEVGIFATNMAVPLTIEDNTFTDVGFGIMLEAIEDVDVIDNIVTGSDEVGIFLFGATNILLDGNTVGITAANEAFGIVVAEFSSATLENNEVTGYDTGIDIRWDSIAAITGGNTIHGNGVGIIVGFEELTLNASTATISGANNIYDNEIGIWFLEGGGGSVAGVDFDGGLSPDNDIDLRIASDAGTVMIGAGNAFAGDTFYIENFSDQSYNLVGIATFDNADPFEVERRLYHAIDDSDSGLIRYVADNLYVPANNTESIQRAIDAAAPSGDTINIEAGTFEENLTVAKSLTLLGAGPGDTIIDAGTGVGIALSGTNTIVLQDFSITGDAGSSSINSTGVTAVTLTNLASSTDSGGTWSGTTGTVTLNTTDGNDTVNVNGNAKTFSTNVLQTIDYSAGAITDLNVNTLDGNDVINVTPAPAGGTNISIDGGAPTSGVGDTLNFNALNLDVTITPNSITAAGRQAVTYTSIETLSLSNFLGITVDGTSGPDTLELFVSNGDVQYVLNNANPVIITGATSFTFNGLEGADQMIIDFSEGNPVPGGGVFFNGGDPTEAPGDQLQIQGGSFDNLVYDMTGHGAGVLTLDASEVTFTGVEEPVEVTSALDAVTINVDPNNDVTGQNDVELTGTSGSMTVTASAPSTTFASMTFSTPSEALTINGDDSDNDVITITSIGNFAGALTVDGQGGTDTIHVDGALSLGSGSVTGNLELTAETINLNHGTISTTGGTDSGSVAFQGAVALGTGVTITTDGSGVDGNVSFNSTVTSPGMGDTHNLTVHGGEGNVTFSGAVGAGTNNALGALEVNSTGTTTFSGTVTASTVQTNAGGTTELNGGQVNTSGSQDYGNAVVLGANTTLVGSAISFGNTLNSDLDNGDSNLRTLSLTANSGNISFTGIVGGTGRLGAATIVDAAHVTASANFIGTSLTQQAGSGTTTLSGANLTGNLHLTTNAITFNSAGVTTNTTTLGGAVLDAQNAVTLNAGLNATGSTISIAANQDGDGSQGFFQNNGATISTTNTTSSAVQITVNTSDGGTGNAALRNIQTGSGGQITVNAHRGSITQTSGTLLNVGTGTVDLSTNTTVASAIGTSGANILTTAGVVTASAGSGGVFITESDGAEFTASATGSGQVRLTSTSGTLTIAGATTTVNGDIVLNSGDAIVLDAAVNAGSGTVAINANTDNTGSQGFTQNSAGSITTTNTGTSAVTIMVGGTGDAEVGEISAGTTGAGRVTIGVNGGAILDNNTAGTLNISAFRTELTAPNGIDLDTRVSQLKATSTDSDITIRQTLTGLLIDTVSAGSGTVTLTSTQFIRNQSTSSSHLITAANLVMTADSGIGQSGNRLRTSVDNLEATNNTSGIFVNNIKSLTIGGVGPMEGISTTSGNIDVSVTGSLSVAEDVSTANHIVLTAVDHADPGRNLTVQANATVSSGEGNVTLRAGDNLTVAPDSVVSGTLVTLLGDFGNADPGFGSLITISGTIHGVTQVEGDSDDDTIVLNRKGSGDITLDGRGGTNVFTVQMGELTGQVNILNTGGSGRLTINATSDDDDLTTSATETTRNADWNANPIETITYDSTLTRITVNGGDGSDVFHVSPSTTAEIVINGGSPSFGDSEVPPGDVLDFNPLGNLFTIATNKIQTQGGFQDVTFIDIESMPLDPIGVGIHRFDMNATTSSPLQSGYTAVLPGTTYTSALGHGWETPVQAFQRDGTMPAPATGAPDFRPLLRDGHFDADPRVFRVDVDPAAVEEGRWYLVSVKMGDLTSLHDDMRVVNADTGQILVPTATTQAGQFIERNFVVQATKPGTEDVGRLRLEFQDLGGSDSHWVVNAIEVRPGEILNMGMPPAVAVADGVTEILYTGFEATADSLITVATTLGTIITPDADPNIAGVQVLSDEFGQFTFTLRAPTGAGLAVVTFNEVTGAKTGLSTVDYSLPTTRRFDFNHGASPTQQPINGFPVIAGQQEPGGYIGVQPGDTYTESRGYGWNASVLSFDRGSVSGPQGALRRDGHHNSATRTFRVDLPGSLEEPQTYWVNLTLGDASFLHDNVRVVDANTGAVLIPNLTTAAGQFFHDGFEVTVDSGSLILEITDQGGSDAFWAINGLEIRKLTDVVPIGFTITLGAGHSDGDGITVDTVHGSAPGVPDGTLLTVHTTMGTITSADANSAYQGTQVVVSDEEFDFTVRRPSVGGTPTFTAKAIDGSAQGADDTLVVFAQPANRFFDFNQSAVHTQSGYTSVLPSHDYTSARGFGWVSATVSALDRGSQPGPQGELRRDGHFDSVPRVFQVDVPNDTYFVNVTLGDATSARDLVRVRNADTGVTLLDSVSTAAGQFFHDGFVITINDGSLNLEFSDQGGNNPFWVVNGLEIRPLVAVEERIEFVDGPGTVQADGSSVYTVTAYTDLAPGSLVTVTTTLGTIITDTSTIYAGRQATVIDGGGTGNLSNSFTFEIRAPQSSGTPTLTAKAIDGSALGSESDADLLAFEAVTTRLFDFNTATSPTQTVGATTYTAVLPNHTYTESLTFGWVGATVSALDRGSQPDPQGSLRRDGHFDSATRVFQADLPGSVEEPQAYFVNVTLGDASFPHDQMRVRNADTSDVLLSSVTTAAGQFFHDGFVITVNDGSLNLEFSDQGGSDPVWVVNGLEIRPLNEVQGRIAFAQGPGTVAADGSTLHTITAHTDLPAGTLVTLTSSLGTIVTDTSTIYARNQATVVSGSGSGSLGNSFTFQIRAPHSGGIPELTAKAIDGSALTTQQDVAVLEFEAATTRLFDFNTSTSPTQTGDYTGVLPNETYTSARGYGWNLGVLALDRGAQTGPQADLRRDGHYNSATRVFQVDVPNDTYFVHMTLGDASFAHDQVRVRNADTSDVLLSSVTTAAGQFRHAGFEIAVSNGSLNLEFSDLGGSDPNWVLNGLEVRRMQDVEPVSFTIQLGAAHSTADGTTVDTVTGEVDLPDGTLITVHTTLGTITSMDLNAAYQGTQVVVNSGEFSFTVRRPTASGTPTFTATSLDGSAFGSDDELVEYVVPEQWRFDFNASSNVTATSLDFVGVRIGHTLAAHGFGWQTTTGIQEVDRAGSGYSVQTVPLYRDFHYSSAPRTFQLAVEPGETYNVRIYAGDRFYMHDRIRLTAEDGTFVQITQVNANQFATAVLVAPDDNGDGILSLTISNQGGSDINWVINGLDIWKVGTPDPVAAPLMAQDGAAESALVGLLTPEDLGPIVTEAMARWSATGLDAGQLALLESVQFTITDLDAHGYLGLASLGQIQIDDNGGGYGWFIDVTPWDDSEFVLGAGGQLDAWPGSPADGRVDLLTVVMHELGHILGRPDLDPEYAPNDLMSATLGTGVRRLPTGWEAAISELANEAVSATPDAQPLRVELPLAVEDADPAQRIFSELGGVLWNEPAVRAGDPRSPGLWTALERPAAIGARVDRLPVERRERLSLPRERTDEYSALLPPKRGDDHADRDDLFASLGDDSQDQLCDLFDDQQ